MEYNYLFLVNENSIEVYREKNNSFEPIKFKGETAYIGNFEEFWTVWEATVAYIPEIGRVDFCIISKVNIPNKYEEYPTIGKSKWNEKSILKFFKEVKSIDVSFIKKNDAIYAKNKLESGVFKIEISPKYSQAPCMEIESKPKQTEDKPKQINRKHASAESIEANKAKKVPTTTEKNVSGAKKVDKQLLQKHVTVVTEDTSKKATATVKKSVEPKKVTSTVKTKVEPKVEKVKNVGEKKDFTIADFYKMKSQNIDK